MTWDHYQRERLALEWSGLRRHFPEFSFYDTTGNTYVSGDHVSNNGYPYRLHISLPPGFPDECPHTYVTSPTPLMNWNRTATIESYGTSSAMHVWQSDQPGWVKICTYRPEQWSAAHSLVKVIRKAKIWIIAYECHLQDGQPLENFVMHA